MWPFNRSKASAARLVVKNAALFTGLGAARWVNRSYLTLATEGFETNPVVYACVTRLARAASSVDLQLYTRRRSGKLERLDRHDILDLLANPNPTTSGRKFIEKLATQKLIGGNAYVLGAGADPFAGKAPGELWLLRPDLMVVGGRRPTMMPEYYEYRPGQQEMARYPIDQVTGRSAVLHLKTVNPLDEWYGLPPLAAASHAADIFNDGQAWNKALLQNECRPSGALQMRQGKDGMTPVLTDEQFARLREEVDANFSGASNAGRPLLLDSSLEWVQMSLSAKDMDHRETMLASARHIAACYGTPPQLVNIPGESTYSNYEQATLAYWSDTVLPFLGALLDDFNRWLPPLFGEKCFLWYDEEQIPALEPRRLAKSTRINAAAYMTIDEKRDAMGLDAYTTPATTGAASLFVGSNQVPVEMAGKVDPNLHPTLAGEEEQQQADGGKKPAKPTDEAKKP